jgi:ribonuclease HII
VKGDSRFSPIAAASVLAKTHRDEFMRKLHAEFPMYGWKRNKGYPTPEHRKAIRECGISIYHRKSFRLLNEQLKIEF